MRQYPLVRLLLLLLLSAALLVPAAAFAKKKTAHKVKAKHTLESGQALQISVDNAGLAACADWDCWFWITTPGAKEKLYRFEMAADGAWVAFGKEEKDEDEDADKDKDKDKKGDEADDDDDSAADWRTLPVKPYEERKATRMEKAIGDYSVEKNRGQVSGDGEMRSLTVPADLLPSGDFEVSSDGYFGLMIEDTKIGSASKTGAVLFQR